MFKKLLCGISILSMITIFNFQSFATSVNDVVYDENTKTTDEFLVEITRPEGDESTFKTSYVICGKSDKTDIRVEILIVGEDGNLKAFENTAGESSWDITGENGKFAKEVVLPNMGVNKIRIAAYKTAEIDNAKLGENLQVNDYSITVLQEKMKNEIKNGGFTALDYIGKAFNMR